MSIALPTIRQPQRRPKVLKRLRLLDLIHQNVHRKLTFICAPAGYGKTTLLIDFAEDANVISCWYQIASEDNDLAQFFRHLLVSLREKYPDFGSDLEELTFQRSSSTARGLATELVNECITNINDFTLLILDDYHIVSEDLEIVSFIENLLEILPDHIRILIGSRSVYGIPTAPLYVNEELAVINADDLRFRASEVRDLARKHFQIHLTNQQAEEIISQADGWIIAILLALRDGAPSVAIPKLEGAREQVYEYLAKEVYDRLPQEIKTFLLVTAVCDEFTPELTNFVMEIENSEKLIRHLEEQNLFIISVQTNQGIVFQYHQLFKDFLGEQFETLPGTKRNTIQRKVAQWFENQDDYKFAIKHYLKADKRQQAAQIMDRHAKSIYVSGQEMLLAEWYQALLSPSDIRHLAPDLVLNFAKIKIHQQKLDECLELLSLAEPILEARNDRDNLANLYFNRGMALRFKAAYREAIELARFTQTYVDTHKLDKYYAYQAARLEGLGLYHIGKPQSALQILEYAQRGFQQLHAAHPSERLKHELVMIYADIGLISLAQSKIFEAQRCFGNAVTLCQMMRGHQGDQATSFNNQAYLYFLLGNFKQAWQAYELALLAAERVGWQRVVVNILNGQAELLIQIDEFDRAKETLSKAEKTGKRASGDIAQGPTYLELSELEKLCGDYNQAMFYLREAARYNNADFSHPDYQIRLGAIYLAMEQLEIARNTLQKALDQLSEQQHPSQNQSLGYFYLAEVCYRLQKDAQAQAHLQQSLTTAAQLGYDHFLVNATRRSPDFAQAISKKWSNKHLRTLTERAKNLQTGYQHLISKSESQDKLSDITLQVRTLGSDEIRVNAEIIPNANWKSARAKALFYFILDRGKAKRDEIAVEFWPDFSNAKVNSNFHATLWRVRNALGHKHIIDFDGTHYSINQQVALFYDVNEYEDILSLLNDPTTTQANMRNLYQQSLDMYEGDFLLEVDMPWSDMRRNELRQKNLELVIRFAEFEASHNRFDEARQLYEYAITLDPYQDRLHLALMKCLVNLKAPAAAKIHFQNYARTLKEELDSTPLEELQQFYNML